MRRFLIATSAILIAICVTDAQHSSRSQDAPGSSHSLPASKRGPAYPTPQNQEETKGRASSISEAMATQTQGSDDELKVLAVSVLNVAPFVPFNMYGVYLGDGAVLTAAHVLGHWPSSANPRIIIAGQEISATLIKKGSFEQTDLALLSTDEASLPISLRLRHDPLCKTPPSVGTNVVVAYPDRTARSVVISPSAIPAGYRSRYNSLIRDVQVSGAGAFDAEKKCLLGIMSAAVTTSDGTSGQKRRAGYFVPASKIADFLPAELRF